MSRSLIAALILVSACEPDDATPVRATLADGQVLVGQVRTDTLLLDGGLGTLAIPLADVGEVVPVEGAELEASGGYVTVWLRNGTELRGRWADPELSMGIAVGGSTLGVELPVQDLTRFQLQGGTYWPDQPVFRVRTAFGDDVLVDAADSRLVLSNELGTFAPFLSECAAIIPGPDTWTVVLHTGTTLKGELQEDALTFALSIGPDAITVPVDRIVSMGWETWSPQGSFDLPAASMPAEEPEAWGGAFEDQPTPRPARQRAADGWFSSYELDQAKR